MMELRDSLDRTSAHHQASLETTATGLHHLSSKCESNFAEFRTRLETSSAVQDKLSATQEKLVTTSEKLHATQASLHNTGEKVAVMQDKIHQTAERVGRMEVRVSESMSEQRSAIEVLREGTNGLMTGKADASDVGELRAEVSRSLEGKADVVQVNEALSHKANIAAINSALEQLQSNQARAVSTEQLSVKADTKDVCGLLDLKSNISDVNMALAELQKNIDARAPLDELRRVVADQGIINASLCADCSIGRWIWKNGKTRHGNHVPWNVQSVNTDPENFSWEKDKTVIMTMAPGLYEVTFGFFTHRKPSVQLLINGEPVLAAVNSSSYVVHHSSGRLT
eukprot:gene15499-18361_t